jgi:uncharacterized protein YqgC (DUF456 family)
MSSPCPKCGRSDFPSLAIQGAVGGVWIGCWIGQLVGGIGWFIGPAIGGIVGTWIAWKASHESADHERHEGTKK